MGHRLIILLLLISIVGYSQSQYGGDYFIAPADSGGSWTGDGSWDDPFIHPQQAVDVAEAGDTIYLRGGIISVDSSFYEQGLIRIDPDAGYGESGTYGNPICYFNYPGEEPIIDCSDAVPYPGSYNYLRVWNITGTRYMNFRGFTVRNTFQDDGDDHVGGFNLIEVTHFNFDQVNVHDIGGRAYYYESGSWDEDLEGEATRFSGYDTSTWTNCDVYNCVDSMGSDPGNSADAWKTVGYKYGHFTWTGCRVWQVADDGYDNTREATMIFDNCWVWDIGTVGSTQGNGNGIKTGGHRDSIPYVSKIIRNCVMVWCNNPESSAAGGLEWIEYQNGGDDPAAIYYRSNGRVYNNVIYDCEFGVIGTSNTEHPYLNNVYRNNLVFGSKINPCGDESNIILTTYEYPESNNSWDWYDPSPSSCPAWFVETDSVTITSADFTSGLDSATIRSRLSAPRQADGSQPATHPFELVEGSDLIDAGTQVWASDSVDFTLSFYGDAPDMGAFESNYGARTEKPLTGGAGTKVVIGNGVILHNNE